MLKRSSCLYAVCVLQLTGSQADLVAAASSGNLQALNSMSTGNLTGLGSNGSLSQSQVWPRLLPVCTTVDIPRPCLVITRLYPALVHGHLAALFMAILCVQPCVMAVADCVNCLAAPNVWCCLAAERQQPTEQI